MYTSDPTGSHWLYFLASIFSPGNDSQKRWQELAELDPGHATLAISEDQILYQFVFDRFDRNFHQNQEAFIRPSYFLHTHLACNY